MYMYVVDRPDKAIALYSVPIELALRIVLIHCGCTACTIDFRNGL